MRVQELIPERLGPYRLIRRLGEGGMGVVYLAEDAAGQLVAVKALRPAMAAEENARRRLAREVETMRRVHSSRVAEVVDADVTSDPPYIVTRYVPGRTLDAVVSEDGPLSGSELAKLARGLAEALVAIHEAGVVHRDLKPGNVMLSDGEPVVIDFGIAQLPDTTKLTMTGMFMGTPGYLAPEVIEGSESGAASDVHSWGATVAYAATGRPPFGTGTFETIFFRIVHGQPNLAALPGPLCPLVQRALSRNPVNRPSAADLSWQAALLDPEALVPGTEPPPGAWPASGLLPPVAGPAPDGSPRPAAGPGYPLPAGGQTLAEQADGQRWPGQEQWPQVPDRTRPFSVSAESDVRDLLPPVTAWPQAGSGQPGPVAAGAQTGWAGPQGQPAWGQTGQQGPRGQTGPQGQPSQSGRIQSGRGAAISSWSPLVLGTIMLLAAVSVFAPVIGTAAALAVLLALRAGRLTARMLGRRRAREGRAGGAAVAVAFYPLALVRALIALLLFAPVALLGFAVAAAATIIFLPVHPLPTAFAFGAGALVLVAGLGPGSVNNREALAGLYGSVVTSPGRLAVAYLGVLGVAGWAVIAAVGQPAAYWVVVNPHRQLFQFPVVHTILRDARMSLLNLAHHYGL